MSLLCFSVPSLANQKATITNQKDKIDSTKIEKSNTKILQDSIKKEKTQVDSINFKKKKKEGSIDAEIVYSSQDSMVFLGNGTGFLHGKGDVKYKDIILKADFIRVKMDSSLIFAHGTTDSLGAKIGEPVFSEKGTEYNSKELSYNLKTKKGFIRQAVTKQGEGFILSDKTKKTASDELCIRDGKYTTCENHDHPDFYLSLSKGKVKPGEYVVSGPAHLVLLDVPLPIAIPFGFFPFTNKYSSGILMPSYTDELTRGFGLTSGGYYFALSDYADLEIRGDIYTKGTWAINTRSNYVKKYKYSGSFNLSYREDVRGEKDMLDYSKAKNLSIVWSHAQDPKANPYLQFSSSVNFSTSGYDRSNINNFYNPNINSQNTKGSSVTFSKRFPESPFSLTGSVLVNQRTKDSTINMTLPNISVTMSRIYPFKRKVSVGKDRWYEKVSMSYTGIFNNNIDTKESKLLGSSFIKDWKNGIKHSIPVNATFTALKYINITPSFNYTERWYLHSYNEQWDYTNNKIIRDTLDGFKRVFDFNMGISAETKFYGFYVPLRALFGDKVDRIRHVMTPSIGMSYNPDFGAKQWGYYGEYERPNASDATQTTIVKYSHYSGTLFGTPGVGKSGSVNFALNNNVEMKLRNDRDTTGNNPFKKISIIDNFSVNGSYNLAADSLRWSQLNTNLRLKLSKSYTLNLSGGFEPYFYGLDKYGNVRRIDKLRWEHGQFPRFLGTSTSLSYTISNDTFKKKKKNVSTDESNPEKKHENLNDLAIDHTTQDNKPKQTTETLEDGYEKLSIPWSLSINYSVRYANTSEFDKAVMEYKMAFTHNLSMSGNLALTKNWKFSSSTSYDFKAKKFTYTSINITRNLHCWTLSGSAVPFGVYKSYYVRIGVNSSMLQDLKYEKRSSYGLNNVNWY